MAVQSLVIVDELYDNPESIRRLALSLDFRTKPFANYPGREAVAAGVDWAPVRETLRSYIDQAVDGPCPKEVPFPQGKFRLAMSADETTRIDSVHEDIQPWSAVIYLSRPEDCAGKPAVGFYRHRATGVTSSTPEWEQEVFGDLAKLPPEEQRARYFAYMRDATQWEEIQRVAMVYNRALLLQAQCFHASLGVFGTEPHNARLTQHFEFYASLEEGS